MWNTQLKPLYYYCKTKEGIIILETAIALQRLSKKKNEKEISNLNCFIELRHSKNTFGKSLTFFEGFYWVVKTIQSECHVSILS